MTRRCSPNSPRRPPRSSSRSAFRYRCRVPATPTPPRVPLLAWVSFTRRRPLAEVAAIHDARLLLLEDGGRQNPAASDSYRPLALPRPKPTILEEYFASIWSYRRWYWWLCGERRRPTLSRER